MNNFLLTSAITTKARDMESEVLLHLKSKPNHTGLTIVDRYYKGYIGELVFEQWLKDNHVKYLYKPKGDGNSGGEDFIVYGYCPFTIEVKTSDSSRNQLMVNAKQYLFAQYDIYVGIRIQNDQAIIKGYCTKHQFSYNADGDYPFYFCEYSVLGNIDLLLPKLEKTA